MTTPSQTTAGIKDWLKLVTQDQNWHDAWLHYAGYALWERATARETEE